MTLHRGIAVRKGRGALSNATGRFEQITREDIDDGWGDDRDDDRTQGDEIGRTCGRENDDFPPPKLRTTLTARLEPHHHRLERFPGPPLRPLHQPLPRLRARLHLLLRAAEPRVPRVLARPRLRIAARVQAGRGGVAARGACQARLRLRPARARIQYRRLPGRSSATSGSPARCSRYWPIADIR